MFDASDLLPMTCATCGHESANRLDSFCHTQVTGHTQFRQDGIASLMNSLVDTLQLKDAQRASSHKFRLIQCDTCGFSCRERAAAWLHTQETGHTSFTAVSSSRDDTTPNPMKCVACGFHCANRSESWDHTEATGHTSFKSIRPQGILGALLGLEQLVSALGDAASEASESEEGGTRVLFHQTSPEAADEILMSQQMRPSVSGLAGGGIYFAESQEATFPKANHHGIILQATVFLGKMKVVHGSADSTTYASLKQEGFDSVKIIGRRSGAEYVIYDWDQAFDIQKVIKRR